MLKKLLVAAGAPFALAVALGTAAPAWADSPGGKGNASVEDSAVEGSADSTQSTGKPDNPSGFGAVSSQLATSLGGIGDHTSFFAPGQHNTDGGGATGRLGVGNVASNDGFLSSDPTQNTGTRPGDHASLIDGFTPEPNLPDTINAFGHPGRLCTTCR